jgi:hypothetical protein
MTYAGFDTDRCPPMALMKALKESTNLAWCVAYPEAPSHANADWDGQLAALKDPERGGGWDVLPVIVGQQIVGHGSLRPSAAQALIDAGEAERRLESDGYAEHCVVALDIENGPPFSGLMADYAVTVCERFAGYGRTPAVYCSHLIAPDVIRLIPEAKRFIFQVPGIAPATAASPFPTPPMTSFSDPQAFACQHRQNVRIEVAGQTLLVDLDVAATPTPSVPA